MLGLAVTEIMIAIFFLDKYSKSLELKIHKEPFIWISNMHAKVLMIVNFDKKIMWDLE